MEPTTTDQLGNITQQMLHLDRAVVHNTSPTKQVLRGRPTLECAIDGYVTQQKMVKNFSFARSLSRKFTKKKKKKTNDVEFFDKL